MTLEMNDQEALRYAQTYLDECATNLDAISDYLEREVDGEFNNADILKVSEWTEFLVDTREQHFTIPEHLHALSQYFKTLTAEKDSNN